MAVTSADIQKALHALDLSGKVLCVHSSLRSFGQVEGGAQAVVDTLLAEQCTVIVPTFTEFGVPPPAGWWLEQNGASSDWAEPVTNRHARCYTTDMIEVAPDMGAIPAAVAAMPERIRGNHPLCSFASIGPLASELIAGQKPLDANAPLRALADSGGFVILMGVGLNRMTLLHLAEQMAGRTLFRRWADGPDGELIEVETGGCSEGFEALAAALSVQERQARVGESLWRVFPAADALRVAANGIRENPPITHCAKPDCLRCNDALLGGPRASPLDTRPGGRAQ